MFGMVKMIYTMIRKRFITFLCVACVSVIPGVTGNLLHNAQEEERLVREAMERTGGNISAAARMLGVSRPTLYAKLKKYGL